MQLQFQRQDAETQSRKVRHWQASEERKAESRKPKAEGKPKLEIRNPKSRSEAGVGGGYSEGRVQLPPVELFHAMRKHGKCEGYPAFRISDFGFSPAPQSHSNRLRLCVQSKPSAGR
jgi:hypothetical protein